MRNKTVGVKEKERDEVMVGDGNEKENKIILHSIVRANNPFWKQGGRIDRLNLIFGKY